MFIKWNPFKGCEEDPFKLAVEDQADLERNQLDILSIQGLYLKEPTQLPRSDRDLNIESL